MKILQTSFRGGYFFFWNTLYVALNFLNLFIPPRVLTFQFNLAALLNCICIMIYYVLLPLYAKRLYYSIFYNLYYSIYYSTYTWARWEPERCLFWWHVLVSSFVSMIQGIYWYHHTTVNIRTVRPRKKTATLRVSW